MQLAVIIPCYNESQNIEALIKSILDLRLNIKIIVVDDSSPDGTGEIVDRLASQYAYVHIIHRDKKNGRGSACITGFKYALGLDVDYILEMDADFSHDPKAIPQFLEKMGSSDVVIGSRYLKESRILNWGHYRPFFSHLANHYARFFLRIPIADYTNGYRCYSKAMLSTIDFNKINSTGYIVLSEIAYQLYKKKARFAEIPITFVNRQRGVSNLNRKEIFSAFAAILRLRFKNN